MESVCTLTGYRGFESHSLRLVAEKPLNLVGTVPDWAGSTVPDWAGSTVPDWAGSTVPVWVCSTVPFWAAFTVSVWANFTVPDRLISQCLFWANFTVPAAKIGYGSKSRRPTPPGPEGSNGKCSVFVNLLFGWSRHCEISSYL